MAPLTEIQLRRFDIAAAQSPLARVRTGARFGLIAGFVLTALTLLAPVLSGTPTRVVTQDGSTASIAALVVSYLVAGPVSGAAFGALFPLMRRDVGAVLVGMLAALPVSFTLTAALLGKPGGWAAYDYAFALIITSAFGAGGFMVRELAVGSPEELDC